MPDLSTLRDLQRRLREATGPDRELDAGICVAARYLKDGQRHRYIKEPEFRVSYDYGEIYVRLYVDDMGYEVHKPAPLTESIDAIRAAVRRAFPNACITINEWADHADFSFWRGGTLVAANGAPTTPLAGCLALVSALIAIEGGKERGDG